jgi:flavin-dependent dehydrogenase
MEKFDVIVVGAGLAGLHTSRLLALAGFRVLLTDRKARLDQGIHTTGIFVRKTLEDFDLPEDCLGPAVRDVTLYSPRRRPLALNSPYDEFRLGRMAMLYERFLQRCISAGVEWMPAVRYEGHKLNGDELIVTLAGKVGSQSFATRYIVGADGASSRVAECLQLDRNREWIVGVEEVFHDVPLDGPPRFHCFIDPRLAPGYIAWVVHDGEEAHIGVGGYTNRFDPARALEAFRESVSAEFDLGQARLLERRGGRIPVNGILRRIANEHGMLVGDAAGAVSPLTAGGFDGCLRLSTLAAAVATEFLNSGNPEVLRAYSGDCFKSRFVSRLWMRRLSAKISQSSLIELGCAVLRLPIFRSFAWHVFFGRGSFPDVHAMCHELSPTFACFEKS